MNVSLAQSAGFACLLSVCAIAASAQTASTKGGNGWRTIFDGKTLAGWTPEGDAKWTVSNGAISPEGGDGWLRSNNTYSDFQLQCDFKNVPKGNTGIFLRATKQTKSDERSNPAKAYELQINNEDAKYATGSIEDYIQRITAVNPAPNQWHHYDVEIRGDHITAALDGVKTLDGKDPSCRSGYVGLQHHKDMNAQFRNVRIKTLGSSTK